MSDVNAEQQLSIYTDGGCHGNPGPGGWAWRAVAAGDRLVAEDAGFEPATTNNRMELQAVIAALRWAAASGKQAIVIRTDSQYVRQGITAWIHRWKRNGWQTANKKPVKNAELWRLLDECNGAVQPEWEWVKGHAGVRHNEACHLAVQRASAQGTAGS